MPSKQICMLHVSYVHFGVQTFKLNSFKFLAIRSYMSNGEAEDRKALGASLCKLARTSLWSVDSYQEKVTEISLLSNQSRSYGLQKRGRQMDQLVSGGW